MCNYLIAENKTCRIISKGDVCHIHKNMKRKFIPQHEIIDIELKENVLTSKIEKLLEKQQNLKKEITNLNNNISKKNDIIKKLENTKENKNDIIINENIINENIINELNEIKNINNQLLSEKDILTRRIRNLKLQNEEKLQKIKDMEQDYNNFQIIKMYEKEKDKLVKNNVDLYNYNNNKFQELRKNRNYIVHVLPLTT